MSGMRSTAASEVVGGRSAGIGDALDAIGAVFLRDVAETALLGAGNAHWWLRSGDAADKRAEITYEALVYPALGNAIGVIAVDDLAGQFGVSVFGQGPWKGVHVDHQLELVPGLLLAGLGVDDEDAVVLEHQ